jgi:hypothetical protein
MATMEVKSSYVQLRGLFQHAAGVIVETSDAREKNSIENLFEGYENFYNELHPVRFKYNNGTSDRYHVGFIAQEINRALSTSELSTAEFAGYVKFSDGSLGLRYIEFIALNTWQIQKLKPRMTAAEQEIASLKLEIQSLRTELKNLKNS